jgi:hypothetical protein
MKHLSTPTKAKQGNMDEETTQGPGESLIDKVRRWYASIDLPMYATQEPEFEHEGGSTAREEPVSGRPSRHETPHLHLKRRLRPTSCSESPENRPTSSWCNKSCSPRRRSCGTSPATSPRPCPRSLGQSPVAAPRCSPARLRSCGSGAIASLELGSNCHNPFSRPSSVPGPGRLCHDPYEDNESLKLLGVLLGGGRDPILSTSLSSQRYTDVDLSDSADECSRYISVMS